MHSEWCTVSEETVMAVCETQQQGGRVVAVGTTAVRSLETAARSGLTESYGGATNLYIRPGYSFRVVDVMLTNFHMPRTTLMVLVSAFAGRDLIQQAYKEAMEKGYRFLSYGDAMLIL
jgi:S-adenosylmethionine:tRNA ribosyltransferase-isomerase